VAEIVDPFSRAYGAIRAAVLAYPPLAGPDGAVKLGNLIDLSADGDARRRIHRANVPADAPDLEIDQGPFRLVPVANSTASGIAQSFIVYLETGARTIATLNRVKWLLFKAIMRSGPDLGLGSLVRGWTITNATDSTGTATAPLAGFTAQFAINVEMSVSHTEILAN
jgi:hypothetical protein